MKVLIAADKSRFFYLKQFTDALNKQKMECNLVCDLDIYDKLTNKKYIRWLSKPEKFQKIISEFKPDVVFTERENHFSLLTAKAKIPLVRYLRGDYWAESKWVKQNTTKISKKQIEIMLKERIAKKCFNDSAAILPICDYLTNITKTHYPNKIVKTLYQGIEPSDWYNENTNNLKHPCVGLLQNVNIWGKAKEMLILDKVIKSLPNVMFYWAGDGPYRDKILLKLKKYDNFRWLGSLEYPSKVREFLSEIDVYALISGQDMSPHTILEAALMKKPIIATNVGGVKESMKDAEMGFLVLEGDYEDLIRKISILINDSQKSKQMGNVGQNFVKENFTWDEIASDFRVILKSNLNLE